MARSVLAAVWGVMVVAGRHGTGPLIPRTYEQTDPDLLPSAP
jgi:hypothetical protein